MTTNSTAAPRALIFLLACSIASGVSAAPRTDAVVGQAVVAADTRAPAVQATDVVDAGPTDAVAPSAAAPAVPSIALPAVAPEVPSVAPPAASPRRTRRPPRTAPAASRSTATGRAPREPATTPANGRISGRLELAAGANQSVDAVEVSESVIYFLPKSGGGRPRPARFTVDTRSKGFSPSLLVVPVGSTVSFPNRDQIVHNVFSKTPGSTFDLGYFAPGQARETRLNKPGLVVVNCSVHNSMRSNVLVLATPYYTRPGRDGRFALDALPPGPGTLVFWHPRAAAQSLVVTGPVRAAVVRRLVAIRAPLDAHRQ